MKTEKPDPPEPPPRNPLRVMASITSSVSSEKTTITPEAPTNEMAEIEISTDIKDTKDSPKDVELKRDDVSIITVEPVENITGNKNEFVKEKSPNGSTDQVDIADGITSENESCKVERLENELRIAKELIHSLKAERKKLRSDKNDLLQQVKQLCASLQDKEQELRNFIRKFDQRIRDSENVAKAASSDSDHDRWTLIKHAQDETERSLALAAQLNVKDLQIKRMEQQLIEARRQLSGCISDQESVISLAPIISPGAHGMMNHGCEDSDALPSGVYSHERGSCSVDSGVRTSDRESASGDLNLSDGACENDGLVIDSDSISLISSHHNIGPYGKEYSPSVSPMNTLAIDRNEHQIYYNRSVQQLDIPMDLETGSVSMARRLKNKPFNSLVGRTGRGGAWGSISRVFARSKNRNKASIQSCDEFQWSPLTEESYAEKIKLLREASTMPLELWRSPQIAAWLEVGLGMPKDCIRFCSENVKSGKVLLELTDAELESGLGATHPMHRKKLRLAIEEQRRPDLVRYPMIGQLGHTWCALEWLHEIGLSQYSESFLHSLVDARMLDTLSKKELEKYLGVTRKFHQASIVHGIHLLRLMKYDRQSLAMRRLQSESENIDPIVWTNQRFIRWVRSIDLGEFADNLRNSGVHGGLVVLESSFSGETMASALGISPSKNIVRRHLITEFESLILPSRKNLSQGIRGGSGIVSSYDRHGNNTLSKGYYVNPNGKTFKTGSLQSPTHSYSSSEGGNYAIMDNRIKLETSPNEINNHNRYSAPLNYQQATDEATARCSGINRRSAPEFLTEN